ncbi:hypothetical protein J4727_05250 [Providencia rettgeri]|uniref:Uncharacterized protein n=1 Tax=Providencia rettgeri TaxID=587 RepID=A0A939NE84_PRORE|nr:hypothetical protein [Providencia rettgeri]
MVQDWQHRQPTVCGEFALDITQNMPENVQINMDWQNVSWKNGRSCLQLITFQVF